MTFYPPPVISGTNLEWFDVVTYGADPSGSQDSTSAIQAAITAAASAGGGLVFFPVGEFKISSSLTITSNAVQLMGSGQTTASDAGTFINWAGGASPMVYIHGCSSAAVSNLVLNDNTNQATYGIRLGTNALLGSITDVSIVGISYSSGTGCAIGNNGSDTGIYDWLLTKVRCTSNYDAFRITGATPNAFTFVQCEFTNNGNCGIHVQRGTGFTITGGDYEYNAAYSFYLEGCTAWTINNPYIEMNSGASAARLSPYSGGYISRGINFIGGYFNAGSSNPNYFMVLDSSGAQDINFIGCHFGANLNGGSAVADINNNGGSNSGSFIECHTSASGVLFDNSAGFQAVVNPNSVLGWAPSDQGLAVWNGDPDVANGSSFTSNPAAGTLYVARLNVRAAVTVSNIAVWWNVGTGTAGSGAYLALFNSSGTQVGSTTGDFSGSSAGILGESIGSVTLQPGTYYVAFLLVTQWGTNHAGLFYFNTISGAMSTFNLTAANYRWAANGTGLSAMPSSLTLSSNTSPNAYAFWCALY